MSEERETTAAEELKKFYDSVLRPPKKRHGKRGMRVLAFFPLLTGGVMVVGFLTLPDPWKFGSSPGVIQEGCGEG